MGSDDLYKRHKKNRDLKRKKSQERILIVCEGEKTESNYFDTLKDFLQIPSSYVKIDPHSDSAPISVVEYAAEKIDKEGIYSEVYCVFDRDTYETFKQALNTINSTKLLKAITSNPCFEYWILLHFKNTTKSFGASDSSPCDELQHILNEILKQNKLPKYTKNYPSFTKIISKDRLTKACKNATIINNNNCKDNDGNLDREKPHTQVVDLVKVLQKLAK